MLSFAIPANWITLLGRTSFNSAAQCVSLQIIKQESTCVYFIRLREVKSRLSDQLEFLGCPKLYFSREQSKARTEAWTEQSLKYKATPAANLQYNYKLILCCSNVALSKFDIFLSSHTWNQFRVFIRRDIAHPRTNHGQQKTSHAMRT